MNIEQLERAHAARLRDILRLHEQWKLESLAERILRDELAELGPRPWWPWSRRRWEAARERVRRDIAQRLEQAIAVLWTALPSEREGRDPSPRDRIVTE